MRQPDMFLEADERLLLRDNAALTAIANALPQNPILKTWQVTAVIPVSEDVVYAWIKDHKFVYVDLGGGSKVRYGIVRKSFLEFLSGRVKK